MFIILFCQVFYFEKENVSTIERTKDVTLVVITARSENDVLCSDGK